MDLFDFFFPDQAQAAYLKKIAAQQRLGAAPGSSTNQGHEEIASLKSDVRFLTLVLAVILKRMSETKTMSLADVQDLIDEVDLLDGAADGGLDAGVLRGLLGVVKQDSHAKADPDNEVFDRIAEMHRRHRK